MARKSAPVDIDVLCKHDQEGLWNTRRSSIVDALATGRSSVMAGVGKLVAFASPLPSRC